jgi:hypothetical protein
MKNLSTTRPIGYEVEGTIGVSVGQFGNPTFGPMTLFSGELRAPGVAD